MAELAVLLQKVFEAQNGNLSQDEQISLESKLEGALFTSELRARQTVHERLKAHDWDYIEGVVRTKLDEHEVAKAGGVNVSASAQATATAAVTLSLAIDAIEHGTLSDKKKEKLEHELVNADAAAKSGNLARFASSVVSACEKAGKCANSLTAVLTFLASLAKDIPTDGTDADRPI